MTKTDRRQRAEQASLCRVCACVINEQLVNVHFKDRCVVELSHPASETAIVVELPAPPMFQEFLHSSEIGDQVWHGEARLRDGADLLRIIGRWLHLDVDMLCLQIENSIRNQALAYSDPRLTIDSSPIEWEQGLQEGLSLHPLFKCRYPVVGEFRTATLHFVAVSRELVQIGGEYEQYMSQLVPDAMRQHDDAVVFPVHELQLARVTQAFPQARILGETITARPEISMRTLALPGRDFVVKIPIDIKISTLVRTLKPSEVMMGQQVRALLPLIEQASAQMGGSLLMVREPAAAATASEHLGCIIRQSTTSQEAQTGDRIIVCATLAEDMATVWGDRMDDKPGLLRDYCHHLFRAVLPPAFQIGLALSAHLQNTLVRVDPHTRAIKGFVVRDLGFFSIHPPTFEAATGLKVDVPKPKMIVARLEDVYARMFSPVLTGHMAMIVRALCPGLAGWRIVREELDKVIPPGDSLARHVWFESPQCFTKAFLKLEFYGRQPGVMAPNPLYHCQRMD